MAWLQPALKDGAYFSTLVNTRSLCNEIPKWELKMGKLSRLAGIRACLAPLHNTQHS